MSENREGKHFKSEGSAPQKPGRFGGAAGTSENLRHRYSQQGHAGSQRGNGAPAATQAYSATKTANAANNSVSSTGAPGAARFSDTTQSGSAMSKPKKKFSISRLISNLLLAVGLILLLVAAGMFIHAQWNYHEQDEQNARLATYAKVVEDGSQAPTVDWAALKAINGDVVAWINIPGTVINYPVYQGKDNDYYLNTTAEGHYGVGGQIFLDYENKAPGMLDQQTIIYGHHLKNGAMFKQVADMDNQEFFNSIQTIWYVTEKGVTELRPLLVYYTDGNDTNVRKFNFGSQQEWVSYLQGLLGKSVTHMNDADKVIATGPRVLTLSTCNYIDGYGRTILLCVEKSAAKAALNPTS